MNNQIKTQRNSNYELLRIIAALIIMFNHINVSFQEEDLATAFGRFNQYVINFFHLGGKYGVNLFVIIGCYFLCDQAFKAKRIIRLVGEVIFYALLLNLVDIIIFHKTLAPLNFIHGFSYWFPFAYVVMLLFIPFIDKFIIPKFENIILLLGAFLSIFFVIWGYVAPNPLFKLITIEQIMGPIWFCYTYVLVGYLKHNQIFDKDSYKKIAPLLAIGCYLLMYAIVIITEKSYIRDMYSPLCFLSALSLFYIFHHMSNISGKWINLLSGCTFGTYLLQCHNNTAKIWEQEIFKYSDWAGSPWLIPICAGSVIILYGLAWICSWVYRRLVLKN